MAKINLEDLEELGTKLTVLSQEWSLDAPPVVDSDKASTFCAGYREGFFTGVAALCHAAGVNAEGGELDSSAHKRVYEHFEWVGLLDYLREVKED